MMILLYWDAQPQQKQQLHSQLEYIEITQLAKSLNTGVGLTSTFLKQTYCRNYHQLLAFLYCSEHAFHVCFYLVIQQTQCRCSVGMPNLSSYITGQLCYCVTDTHYITCHPVIQLYNGLSNGPMVGLHNLDKSHYVTRLLFTVQLCNWTVFQPSSYVTRQYSSHPVM